MGGPAAGRGGMAQIGGAGGMGRGMGGGGAGGVGAAREEGRRGHLCIGVSRSSEAMSVDNVILPFSHTQPLYSK